MDALRTAVSECNGWARAEAVSCDVAIDDGLNGLVNVSSTRTTMCW
jgi:hypothetical protein